jgi:hypothetical protein
MEIKTEVIRLTGTCNADLQIGDTFLLRGADLVSQGHSHHCALLCGTIAANAGRLCLGMSPLYLSCQDPGGGDGGNVTVAVSEGEA